MPNRFVLVDEDGLVYERTGVDIKIDMQDDGKTMKVFLNRSQDAAKVQLTHFNAFAHDIKECPWPH